ncbi:class 1b ribonucleoside-diphosphate reductase subunit beta [Macrococcus armenti]|uniref:class 1b ribonucleoside-diphosphate reductase subunit beta n=1 Tax=Macrococcus armenti TaxID=2875764 RepID=UPI001CCBD6D8|nr:class 1b ribonucleoside-diphosphate reductase subunit beta [Macrococcus armenti]UBH21907.1 class 1b ribonucleoside-diphosphate reductase subunit beta [Macrococcus armenti]
MHAINWNKPENIFNVLWRQNIAQMWTDTEFKVSRDIPSWEELSLDEKAAYSKILAGLTGLDTLQGDVGMPLIMMDTDTDRKRAVFSFMAFMEHMHAKSYSTIFTTLLPPSETDYLLDEFTKEQPQLVKKADKIAKTYLEINPDISVKPMPYKERGRYDLFASYMARVASVFLESFLFYSGFYYPLYLKGNGKMVASGEIIRKILLDESIHGVAVGLDAQDIYKHLDVESKAEADKAREELLQTLYDNEVQYAKEIYSPLGSEILDDVLRYVRYNANKALANLGVKEAFPHEEFNPVVMNALDTKTSTHDFFSVKGDGYEIARNSTPLADEDFVFNFDN